MAGERVKVAAEAGTAAMVVREGHQVVLAATEAPTVADLVV